MDSIVQAAAPPAAASVGDMCLGNVLRLGITAMTSRASGDELLKTVAVLTDPAHQHQHRQQPWCHRPHTHHPYSTLFSPPLLLPFPSPPPSLLPQLRAQGASSRRRRRPLQHCSTTLLLPSFTPSHRHSFSSQLFPTKMCAAGFASICQHPPR